VRAGEDVLAVGCSVPFSQWASGAVKLGNRPPTARTGRLAGAQVSRRRGVCTTDRPNDPSAGSCLAQQEEPHHE
jgi:hypothetical protein